MGAETGPRIAANSDVNLAGERESPRAIINRKLTSNDEDINEQLKQAGLLMGRTTTFYPQLRYSSFP